MQGALAGVKGVKSAEVGYKDQRAMVTYSSKVIKPVDLIAVVEEAGFTAVEENAGNESTEKSE